MCALINKATKLHTIHYLWKNKTTAKNILSLTVSMHLNEWTVTTLTLLNRLWVIQQ
jgi:hypothetical protein